MISTVGDILDIAESKGITDKEIRELSGRTSVTIWRWKKNREAGFDFDIGMRKLIERLNG